jgi:hypothetical protein
MEPSLVAPRNMTFRNMPQLALLNEELQPLFCIQETFGNNISKQLPESLCFLSLLNCMVRGRPRSQTNSKNHRAGRPRKPQQIDLRQRFLSFGGNNAQSTPQTSR